MATKFQRVSFGERLGSMLKVDFRRMLRSRLFYILIACALGMPILMTVMTARSRWIPRRGLRPSWRGPRMPGRISAPFPENPWAGTRSS